MNLKEFCENNDLQHLIDEWNDERLISDFSPKTKQKVYWKCKNNHQWEARIDSRTNGTNCPYCSNRKILKGYNDLLTYCKNNELQNLINEFNDKELSLDELFPFSNKKVYWKCKNNHRWKVSPNNRISDKTGCPVCTNQIIVSGENDFVTYCKINNKEYLIEEWDYNKNIINPNKIAPFSNKKVWWKCKRGHSWEAVIGIRNRDRNCPRCNNRTSFGEQCIYYYLLPYKAKNRFKLDNIEIDIYLPNKSDEVMPIGIEFNGNYWHENRKEKDLIKELRLSHKVTMYYVCESDKNEIKGNKIFFNKHKYNLNLEWALKELFNILNLNMDVNIERDKQLIYKNSVKEEKEKSLAFKFPELLKEWDYEKNIISPDQVTSQSAKKVYWKCKNNHQWEAKIYNRTVNKNNCPICNKIRYQ